MICLELATTRYPREIKALVRPRPMPLEAPVIIAVFLVFMIYAPSQMIVVAKFDYAAIILVRAFVGV
jgi:hypothetical protein